MLDPVVVQLLLPLLASDIWLLLLFTRCSGGSDFGLRIETTLFETTVSFERLVCLPLPTEVVVVMNDDTRGGTAIGGDSFGNFDELLMIVDDEAVQLTEADWALAVFEVCGGGEWMVVQNATIFDDFDLVEQTMGD